MHSIKSLKFIRHNNTVDSSIASCLSISSLSEIAGKFKIADSSVILPLSEITTLAEI